MVIRLHNSTSTLIMIITLDSTRKARIQSVDLEGNVITFQLLDSDENPIGQPGQHGAIGPENVTLPMTEEVIAAAILNILPEEASE